MKYYEISFRNQEEAKRFIDCVIHELNLRMWDYKDLAEKIGKSPKTVWQFIYTDKKSRFVAADIANLFQLQRKEWV